jgi:thioester reductase-like protein
MGHSETGVSNTTDHIARYIAGCIEIGAAPILNESASLTPVNQLSQALSYIALNSKEQGNTYHLCNPDVVTVGEIYQQIQNAGFPLELISYTQWKERLKAAPITNPLYPLLSLHIHSAPIKSELSRDLTLPELYENNARFDCTQFMKAIEKSGIKIELKDPAIIEGWLRSYLEGGLISKATFNKRQSHSLCEE